MLRRYVRSNFLFWFGTIFTLAGLIIFAAAVYAASKTVKRKQGYYQTAATVVGKRIFHHLSGGDSHYLEYRYTSRDGRSHQGDASVSTQEYGQSEAGRQFQVNVSVANPNDAWPSAEGEPTFLVAIAVVFLGLCFFIPGAVIFGLQVRRILRSVAALERGQYVAGRVENIIRAHQYLNGRPLYLVEWSWQGSDKKRRKAKSLSLSGNDASHWRRGDEIAAYTHPSDPEFAEADVFGLRANR